jgi:hypothetical protein
VVFRVDPVGLCPGDHCAYVATCLWTFLFHEETPTMAKALSLAVAGHGVGETYV